MFATQRSVLIVDDSPEDRTAFVRFLCNDPEVAYSYVEAETVNEGLTRCREQRFDVILVDYGLPDDDGIAFLRELIDEHGPDAFAVVMVTGLGDVAVAAAAIKLGAQDYLVKGVQLERHLSLAVASAIEKAGLRRRVEQQRRELALSNEQLRRTVAELVDERAALARRVEERTADLRTSNAALAQALRLKDEFLAVMSHELRTPINAVLGRAESLREEIYGPLTESQQTALQSVEESARHLLALITDILDFSKIEAGRLALELEETQVDLICRQSLRLVAQAAQSKGVTVGWTFDSTVDLIYADGRRLKQILVNLLSNAVKFTPAGGQVGLEVQGDRAGQTIAFTVWDTGIGIAEEDLARLFQPFMQVDSSLTRQHGGTGLGLALVRRLVEAHGGSVSVESTPGAGSRFRVTLAWQPGRLLERHPDLAAASAEGAGPRPGAEQPLIEDAASDARQLVHYFAELGAELEVYSWGVDVVERVAVRAPNLIVLDLTVADDASRAALHRLRADERTGAIPVLALVDREEPDPAGRLAVEATLVRPLLREPLLRAIAGLGSAGAAPQLARVAVIRVPPGDERPLILVAEDNDENLNMLRDYLLAYDYGVVVARDGNEALLRASELRPDLILMDVQMPLLDGLEAIRRLRADRSQPQIPIIALTALVMPGDRERCLAAGASAYLPKPISLRTLLGLIDAHLRPGA